MQRERTLLVTVELDARFYPDRNPWAIRDEAEELRELAASAGAQVIGSVVAKPHRPVAATFIGSGKLQEIADTVAAQKAGLVIFNQELSPAQQRNIEAVLKVKTVDRTQLILDIFAQRARSQEGKVQVELAQLKYLLPRLVGQGVALSRLGGGIGTRGPGEQKLEVDRRRIRERITRLQRELKKMGERRQAIRSKRRQQEVPVVALVGYTNAGKSTLLNTLTGEAALAQNQLFTTLDPLARRHRLPAGVSIVVTDTVGFLHHLPHNLVESFKATLEEAQDADVLVHVLDASHPLVEEHAQAVRGVLHELGLEQKPIVTALNKIDLIEDPQALRGLVRQYTPAVALSARTGDGLEDFRKLLEQQLMHLNKHVLHLRIPLETAEEIRQALGEAGQIVREKRSESSVEVWAQLPPEATQPFVAYIIP